LERAERFLGLHEILRLVRRGWTNGELAAIFELSEKHISHVINARLRWPVT
jgi:hypothetical protein